MQDFFNKIIEEIKTKKYKKEEIDKLKTKLAKEFSTKRIPTNIEILLKADKKDQTLLKKYIHTKTTRTISGVAPVAVMTKPSACPHGRCTMCPGGLKSAFGDTPQSYTGHEPATMRGKRADYDAYIQIFNRLEQYILLGHNIDKVELIIMGGTFPATPKEYQEEFVTDCFKALNDFSKEFFSKNELDIDKFKEFFELPHTFEEDMTQKIIEKIKKLKKKSTLEKEQKKNEKAKLRCIGLTIETKPDWGLLKHGNEMLRLGCTRVELGVQTLYDDVLKKINRGHTLKETIESIKILKDLGFKLNFHFMIGLPLMNRERDIQAFRELFENENFRPDMMKIYPCMVSRGTLLYLEMKSGNFKPLTTEQAADIISEGEMFVEKYCRIMRVQRDIPPKFMENGILSNLRQHVDEAANKKGIICQCIRCRELGRHDPDDKIIYNTMEYNASEGKEFFISADTKKQDAIVGFVRMRYPSQILRKEITKDSAIIRELHVYGSVVPIGESGLIQHKGVGKELLRLAEKQAKKDRKKKLVVISGIGAREYYKKLGYKQEGPYMVKKMVKKI